MTNKTLAIGSHIVGLVVPQIHTDPGSNPSNIISCFVCMSKSLSLSEARFLHVQVCIIVLILPRCWRIIWESSASHYMKGIEAVWRGRSEFWFHSQLSKFFCLKNILIYLFGCSKCLLQHLGSFSSRKQDIIPWPRIKSGPPVLGV